MNCQFYLFCGQPGKRTHLIKGPKDSDLEVLHLCEGCRTRYQQTINRMKDTVDQKLNHIETILNELEEKQKMEQNASDNMLLIPVTWDNQTYVENVCINGGYTFQTFFEHLLLLYKKSLNEPLMQEECKPEPKQKKNPNNKVKCEPEKE